MWDEARARLDAKFAWARQKASGRAIWEIEVVENIDKD
jgi:hypothetical protein